MYRFLSLLIALFLCVSCFSHGNSHEIDNDFEPVSNGVDYDYSDDDIAAETDDSDTGTDDADTETDDSDSGTETDDSDTVTDDSDTGSGDADDTDDTDDCDTYTGFVCDPEVSDCDHLLIRIVAGNITSGNGQSYDPGHGIRIFQALKPDIALVQEMNYGNKQDADYKNFAQQIVGTNYYVVEDSSNYSIPNGIVSRYPIKDTGSWNDPALSDRELKWAVVDIPGETDIFAISVHLHTEPAGDQAKAAQVIVEEIAKIKSSNPGKYYYVVGGDFNGSTAVSSNGFGKNSTFYVDGPDPVDENGNAATNRNRNKQYDFVLADYPLHEFQVPTVYYSSEDSTKTKCYDDGFVFDTRLYSQSELDEYFYPAQTNDSGASSMQHMAVVKDFFIEFSK